MKTILESLSSYCGNDVYTVDDAIETVGFGKVQLRLAVLAGALWVLDGVEMTLLTVISPEARCSFSLTPWQEAFIVSVVFTGMILGGGLWGKMSDVYGRKKTLFVATIATVYFSFLSAFSITYAWLLILRGLTGFAMSGLGTLSVTMFFEFSPTRLRSRLLVFLQIVYSAGMMLSVLLAMLIMHSFNWHYLLAIATLLCAAILPLFLLIPESAHFFMATGQHGKAQIVLNKVAEASNRKLPPGQLVSSQTKHQLLAKNIGLTAPEQNMVSWNWRTLFCPVKHLCSTLLIWLLWFLVAFFYFGLILMTSELLELYHDAFDTECVESLKSKSKDVCHHLSTSDYWQILWTTAAELPAIAICFFLNEVFPRRRSIAIHGAFGAIFMGLTIVCPLSKPAMFGLIFASRSFVASLFQTLYLYTPEVYTTHVRTLGLGMSYVWARVGGLVTPFVAQVMLHDTVKGTKAVYTTAGVVIMMAGILLPFETKGRKLDDSPSAE